MIVSALTLKTTILSIRPLTFGPGTPGLLSLLCIGGAGLELRLPPGVLPPYDFNRLGMMRTMMYSEQTEHRSKPKAIAKVRV
jgi:hypothetical protein